jgi:hypothetical protein
MKIFFVPGINQEFFLMASLAYRERQDSEYAVLCEQCLPSGQNDHEPFGPPGSQNIGSNKEWREI